MRTKLVLAASLSVLLGAPAAADAFCGFYVGGAGAKLFNNATQVVLMREGTRTVLAMQNNYQGPPSNFAMIVPVPMVLQKEMVKTLPKAVFARVDKLGAPRLVEYWERDPCYKPRPRRRYKKSMSRSAGAAPAAESKADKDLGVTVEAQFEVGEYEIVILSAKDSTGLETWLKREKYSIPAGAAALLAPYVKGGSKFFVAKVNVQKVTFDKEGQVALSPLRFHYDSQEFSLPIRLGLANAKDKQDLIVHILAKRKRYEVANYKNVTIPTNLDLKEEAKKRFGEFYAALFDRTLEKNPGAVVTEYSWDASTCDPCPSPPLSYRDIATLGLDVLNTPLPVATKAPANKAGGAVNPNAKPGAKKSDPLDLMVKPGATRKRMRRRPSRRWRPRGFVLTRLHARYGKDSIKNDLIFKETHAIAGGRETRRAGGKLEEGSVKSHVNNFQARYAIRHAWTGPITCDKPQRGVWGGPPNHQSQPKLTPAMNLAFAPRGKITLAKVVNQDIPEVGVKATGSWAPTPKSVVDAKKSRKKAKKGCSVSSGDLGGGATVLLVGLFFASLARRRKV